MKFLQALQNLAHNKLLNDKSAVHWDQKDLTYADLLSKAETLAEAFHTAGIGPGTVVCTAFDNTPAFLVALLACNALGAAFAPMDCGLTQAEALGLIEHCKADVLVTSPELRKPFEDLVPSLFILDDIGSVMVQPARASTHKFMDPAIGLVQFSSGTTGKPKAILISHDAFFYRSEYIVTAIGLTDVDRTLCALPLSHTHGLECLAMPTLLAGGTLHLHSPRLAFPLYILQELPQQKISFFSSIPQFYDFAVKLPAAQAPDLSALSFPFCGSAALAKETASQFFEKYGVHIKQGYGLVELSVICLNYHDAEPISYDAVGRPIEGVTWRIDGDQQEGELLVRSRAMFHSYLDNPEETAAKLQNGWLHTGDLVSIGEDGLFRIVGRKDDFIKVGGFKVYAAEVEAALIALPEVKECAVVSVKDALGSESIAAHIVPCDGSDRETLPGRILKGLRPRLSDYKLPRSFVFTDSLPKSRLGKIAKAKLVPS